MAQPAPIWEGLAIEHPPPPEWKGLAIEVVGGLDSDTVTIVAPVAAEVRMDLAGRGIGADFAGLRGGI